MNTKLIERIFEIQRKIDEVTLSKYEGVDQGMFVPQESNEVYWRDNSYWNDDDKIYSFSFSTDGDCEGDIPPDCVIDVLSILDSYKTK
jgi:hypothetical protein